MAPSILEGFSIIPPAIHGSSITYLATRGIASRGSELTPRHQTPMDSPLTMISSTKMSDVKNTWVGVIACEQNQGT